jgi:GAF domain-containing protein
VSLIDENRQWFKARVGLGPQETHRDLAFCDHAIHFPENVFVINDTHADKRFEHNGLVTGAPFIRFYAGAPLVTSEGFPVGTLCAIDRKPRKLTDAQIKALQTLSKQV